MPHGNGELVLVIDDEAAVRQITKQTLETYGYRVLLVSRWHGRCRDLLQAQHRDEIDVVLTDVMMPMMDGPATIQAIHQINPTMPVIAASGLSTSEHVNRATRLGVRDSLPEAQTLRGAFSRPLGESVRKGNPHSRPISPARRGRYSALRRLSRNG